MRAHANGQALDEFAVVCVHDERTAVRRLEPPARGDVKLGAVKGDARAVAAAVVLLFPENFFRLEVKRAEPAVRSRVINRVPLHAPAEPSQSLLEVHVDAPHELVPVINVEDENALARTALGLRAVRRAQVEVAFEF